MHTSNTAFQNKVVLVTGGSVGIGRASALAFAAAGAAVVVAARREAEGVAVVKAIEAAGGRGSFVRADVSNEADVVAMVAHTIAKWGRLDVLVNNAGIEGKVGPIDTLTAADLDETFGVNVRGTWSSMKHALPHLTQSKGNIINLTSVVADIGMAGTSIYAASKGAVSTMTRATAMEFIKSGVRVNAVSPGPVETDMGARFFGSIDNMRGFAEANVPAGAAAQPADIAAAVLFVASNDARFMVGQIVTVDGGLSVQ